MKPKTFMLIAGEASGDLLAAELVSALRGQLYRLDPLLPLQFFGAGGPKMADADVELAFDLVTHAVIGITDTLKNYFKFRQMFNQLLALAIERKPDVVIGVDYGGFNLRFGHAVKEYARNNPFANWNPKIVQFVSPQVWASRPGRANLMEANYDMLLSIFPFEKDWYAKRVPKLRVEFVGHPMVERFKNYRLEQSVKGSIPTILLLPGSRISELSKHIPVMREAAQKIKNKRGDVWFQIVLPNHKLLPLAESAFKSFPNTRIAVGGLAQFLSSSEIAIASTGTVTMECAFFGVPTVTLYKTSWLTYEIGKRIVTVKSLTMPNLMAGEEVYPEFIQNDATPENLSRAALELLQDESRRTKIKSQLAKIISSLGEPGAAGRAATVILSLFP
jgi:lipid-A-disaccharide synthase